MDNDLFASSDQSSFWPMGSFFTTVIFKSDLKLQLMELCNETVFTISKYAMRRNVIKVNVGKASRLKIFLAASQSSFI